MSHTVEILSVGTELLLGSIVNSDAQALSRELSALGLNVLYHSVVGDNPGRLKAAVELALSLIGQGGQVPPRQVFRPALVVRGTTAPPPPGQGGQPG